MSVEDTGQGLSAAQIAQLFKPFSRLGQESGGPPGTGIGLVICKRLVELMGGRIGVDSTPGVGSCFWFELGAALPNPVQNLLLPGTDPATAEGPVIARGAECTPSEVAPGPQTGSVDQPTQSLEGDASERAPDLAFQQTRTGRQPATTLEAHPC